MAEYYDMQEVMAKLRKSEEEVQSLVKEGRLRQYMDSGKAVFKVEDVDTLAEEVVGLDISAFGQPAQGEESNLDIMLEETSEVQMEPEDIKPPQGDDEEIDLDLEPDLAEPKESEGGFGLSQMGDMSSADTNVSSIGINILSGTGDAYKLTEDTGGETQAEADIDDLDSLDADSNLESFGSGSGLLDLSLQADDTSLGAVLDDILPTGAEGGGGANMGADEGVGLLEEPEDLLSPDEPAEAPVDVTAPMGEVQPTPAMPAGAGVQMVAVAPVDPKSGIFGVMMILPLATLIGGAIVLSAAIQGVTPSLLQMLTKTKVAGFSLIWAVVAGLAVLLLLVLAFSAVGGGGGAGTKKAKPAKAKKEKKPKKEKARRKKKK